ncbi:hypothetical protein FHS30_001464 [Simiduia aestuariiviva]|uniref:Uncharacterized protein n=1 Tax=Simiduia aestuariiviva TaxID=1510459 RepID=A0A839UP19_9GAMM|nr:hypothetical protein [Simiduia aestuariiviva]
MGLTVDQGQTGHNGVAVYRALTQMGLAQHPPDIYYKTELLFSLFVGCIKHKIPIWVSLESV